MIARLCLVGGFCVLCTIPAHAQKKYVDPTAPGSQTGNDWPNAYHTVQQGIDALALSGGDVLVAHNNTYYPTLGTGRFKTIRIRDGVHLRGGFKGYNGGATGSEDPKIPDGSFVKTILSGDIGTPDDTSDNCYHVVTAGGPNDAVMNETVIDGFKITAGRADAGAGLPGDHGDGAGLLSLSNAKILVENVTFRENVAEEDGGGAFVRATQNFYFHCKLSKFKQNIAHRGAGLHVSDQTIDASLCNLRIRDNGNQVQEIGGWPPITDKGGGIYMGREVEGESANLLIHDNFAYLGGGVFVQPHEAANSEIDYWFRHCTITQNAVPSTMGAVAGAGVHVAPGDPGFEAGIGNRLHIDNSILYGNATGSDLYYAGTVPDPGIWLYVNHTDVGTRVILGGSYRPNAVTVAFYGTDPIFRSIPNRDFRLSNQIGSLSPCVEAASLGLVGPDFLDIDENPATTTLPLDRGLDPRVMGSPDMGAYETLPSMGS